MKLISHLNLRVIILSFICIGFPYAKAQSASGDKLFSDAVHIAIFNYVLTVIEIKSGVSRTEFERTTFDEVSEYSKDFSKAYLACFDEGTVAVTKENVYFFKEAIIESKKLAFDEISEERAIKDFNEKLSNIDQGDVSRCQTEAFDQVSKGCQFLRNSIEKNLTLPLVSKICIKNATNVALQKKGSRTNKIK